jgi:hypothetical protein
MTTTEGWKPQTTAQNRATYRMFADVCGDRPINSYTKKDLGSFKEFIQQYSKDPQWRGLTLREIVQHSNVDRLYGGPDRRENGQTPYLGSRAPFCLR